MLLDKSSDGGCKVWVSDDLLNQDLHKGVWSWPVHDNQVYRFFSDTTVNHLRDYAHHERERRILATISRCTSRLSADVAECLFNQISGNASHLFPFGCFSSQLQFYLGRWPQLLLIYLVDWGVCPCEHCRSLIFAVSSMPIIMCHVIQNVLPRHLSLQFLHLHWHGDQSYSHRCSLSSGRTR